MRAIRALADVDLLAVVFFTVVFGAATGQLPTDRKAPILAFFDGVTDVSMVIIRWVLELAPYGVFALSASAFASFGAELIGSLLMFCLTVIASEEVFGVGVLGAVVAVFVRMNPVTYFRKIARASLVACFDVVVERGAAREPRGRGARARVAATASAISGAGVPGMGMVTILIVLNAVGMRAQAQG